MNCYCLLVLIRLVLHLLGNIILGYKVLCAEKEYLSYRKDQT